MKIPAEALEQHIIVLGKTGAGKSYTLRLLIEFLLQQKRRVCIVDPKGDHWGIKSSSDGKSPGFPVVIFGGDHADVPLNSKIGKEIAELVATGNRPAVIDFRGWMPSDRTHFWIDFSSTLFKLNRSPLWLIIDEVHNFAPQGKVLDPDAGKSLHWTNRLASEGRGIGIKLLMASQRPQKVHKDTVTCAETLIAMRVIHPLDRNAMKEWIDGIGDVEKGKLVLNSLASIQRGEAFVWSPEIQFFEQIKFPLIKTFDSFKAPTNMKQEALTGWASVNLEEVKIKLNKVIEQAKENDPEALKRRIRELEKKQPVQVNTVIDEKKIREVFGPREKELQNAIKERDKEIQRLNKIITGVGKLIGTNPGEPKMFGKISILPDLANRTENIPKIIPERKAAPIKKNEDEPSLGKGEKKILIAIAQHREGVDREQITVLTGYKRSSRDTYIQRLSQAGYCVINDGLIHATDAGVEFLGDDYESLPTGDELRSYWLGRLSGGERVLFETVISCYPESVDRDKLTEETNYKRSSRDTYIQRLAQRKLIKVLSGSRVIASEKLFN